MRKNLMCLADRAGLEPTSANFARFAAIFLCDLALVLGVVSALKKESEQNHTFYDAANMIGCTDGFFMLSSRILDRMAEPELSIRKKFMSSVVGGASTLALLWTQAFLCGLSVANQFKQPPILPVLLSSIISFPVALLNWDWSELKKNTPRFFAISTAATALSLSVICLQQENDEKRRYYFQIAAMLQNGAFLFDLSNRVGDICITNADKTTRINKVTIVAAFLVSLLSVGLGISDAAKCIKLPLAMQNILLHCLITFYGIAQMRFLMKDEAAAIVARNVNSDPAERGLTLA